MYYPSRKFIFAMRKIVYDSVLQTTKQARKMAEITALKLVCQLILGGYYSYVTLLNIDNIKGWVLIAIAAVSGFGFGIAKLYFYIKKEKRIARREEYELAEMERQKRIKDRQESTTTQ